MNTPWIESGIAPLQYTSNKVSGKHDWHHAIFAARLSLKPFAQISNFKWGFSDESLLLGAIERQNLFIESQHPHDDTAVSEPADRRSLALRCIRNPKTTTLQLTLLAKVSSKHSDKVVALALEYWQEIKSIFPYDYILDPAVNRDEFLDMTGHEFLDSSKMSITELSRFEGLLAHNKAMLYLLSKWNGTATSNEQVWRAMSGSNQPLMLNITLQPTTLFDYETLAIDELIITAKSILDDDPLPFVKREVEWVLEEYPDHLNQLRYPFLSQVLLVGQGKIPSYIARVIGTSIVQNNKDNLTKPLYQVSKEYNNDSLTAHALAHSLRWLEPRIVPSLTDKRLDRFCYLANSLEARTLFRLPFPPKGNLPGVQFSTTITN